MNEKIIQAILKTFGLSEADTAALSHHKEINKIKYLPELIKCAMDEKCPPKILGIKLEQVILNIRLKKEKTVLEREFMSQIDELVYKPMYEDLDEDSLQGYRK